MPLFKLLFWRQIHCLSFPKLAATLCTEARGGAQRDGGTLIKNRFWKFVNWFRIVDDWNHDSYVNWFFLSPQWTMQYLYGRVPSDSTDRSISGCELVYAPKRNHQCISVSQKFLVVSCRGQYVDVWSGRSCWFHKYFSLLSYPYLKFAFNNILSVGQHRNMASPGKCNHAIPCFMFMFY